MCGSARTGDDGLQAAIACGPGVFEQEVGRAVRGDDPYFVGDAKGGERVSRSLHRLPVGSRAHDDSDHGFHKALV